MEGNCPYEIPFKDDNGAKIAYMVISAFSASLSITGSSSVIYIILRGGWSKLLQTRNRILFGASVIDICSSVAMGLSIIPTPQETDCSIGMGNLTTCAVQGFFIQLGFAVPAYSAMLSLYFLLTIRYGMTQATVAKKYELYMHAFALVPTLSTAIIGVAKDMFFSESAVCWIGDICQSTGDCPNRHASGKGFIVVVASVIFICLCTITTIVCMIAVSWTLRQKKQAMLRYGFRREINAREERRPLNDIEFAAKESGKQAYLYATAYGMTYIGVSCDLLASHLSGNRLGLPVWFHFHFVGLFLPLQGLWHFFAYVRPIVSKIRRDNDDLSYMAALNRAITGIDGTLDTTEETPGHPNDTPRRNSLFLMPIQEN